jgi:hypothetical protein
MGELRWIRASEVQAYSFCARSWWLRYVLELEPADRALLTAGTSRHQAQGRRVMRSEVMGRAALLILLAALLLAALAVVWLLRGG